MQVKRFISNPSDNQLIEHRSLQQSCHITRQKLTNPATPIQTSKPSNLIQSLTGLCKFFNKDQEFERKQISYVAPKSIQRSSASLSPRQQIPLNNATENTPSQMKQLIKVKETHQKENKMPYSPKIDIESYSVLSDFKSIPNFQNENKQHQLVKINDSSHKKHMGKFAKNQKSRNASLQLQEDWRTKYLELQSSLCQRIQDLENELECMEENRKIDQLHSDEQTNQYIQQLQQIIQDKENSLGELEIKNQQLQNIVLKQEQEIQKLKDNQINGYDQLELQRLIQIEIQFKELKNQMPQFNLFTKKFQEIFDKIEIKDINSKPLNNLSISSVSMIEINDIKDSDVLYESQTISKFSKEITQQDNINLSQSINQQQHYGKIHQ